MCDVSGRPKGDALRGDSLQVGDCIADNKRMHVIHFWNWLVGVGLGHIDLAGRSLVVWRQLPILMVLTVFIFVAQGAHAEREAMSDSQPAKVTAKPAKKSSKTNKNKEKSAQTSSTKRNTKKSSGGGGAVPRNCEAAYSALKATGVSDGVARCYVELFIMETSCRHTLKQKKGQAGNANAGYGICSIERDPGVRSRNNRGPACRDISTLSHQVACCRAIMQKSGRKYFGPVKRGKVAKCE